MYTAMYYNAMCHNVSINGFGNEPQDGIPLVTATSAATTRGPG